MSPPGHHSLGGTLHMHSRAPSPLRSEGPMPVTKQKTKLTTLGMSPSLDSHRPSQVAIVLYPDQQMAYAAGKGPESRDIPPGSSGQY